MSPLPEDVPGDGERRSEPRVGEVPAQAAGRDADSVPLQAVAPVTDPTAPPEPTFTTTVGATPDTVRRGLRLGGRAAARDLPQVAAGSSLASVVLALVHGGVVLAGRGSGLLDLLLPLLCGLAAGAVAAVLAVATTGDGDLLARWVPASLTRPGTREEPRVPGERALWTTAALVLLLAATPLTALGTSSGLPAASGLAVVLVVLGAAVPSARVLLPSAVVLVAAWTVVAVLVGDGAGLLALFPAVLAALGLHVLRRADVASWGGALAQVRAGSVDDQATGALNRRGLELLGSRVVAHARRQGDAVHCVLVAVTLATEGDGQRDGDAVPAEPPTEVLAAVADALTGTTRATDVVARWSEDTFAVLGPGPGIPPLELARRTAVALPGLVLSGPVALHVDAGGVVLPPWEGGDMDELLTRAEHELTLRRAVRRHLGAPREPWAGRERRARRPSPWSEGTDAS